MRKMSKALLFIIVVLNLSFISLIAHAEDKKQVRVVMIANTPDIKDHSFNENLYNGLQKSRKKYADKGLLIEYRTLNKSDEYKQAIDSASSSGRYDIIITVGSVFGELTKNASLVNPSIKYISIDNEYDLPPANYPKNLVGITFDEFQAGYLAGLLAGGLTDKYHSALPGLNSEKKVGVLQAMDIQPIRRFANGFSTGVKKLCPDCSIAIATVNSFHDPDKSKMMADSMFKDGIDIMFVLAAGGSGATYDVAKKQQKYIIRGDVDQNYLSPDVILTSALKRSDNAIENIMSEIMEGKFSWGRNVHYDIVRGGVDIAPFHGFDAKIPKELKATIAQGKKDLLSGKIKMTEKVKHAD